MPTDKLDFDVKVVPLFDADRINASMQDAIEDGDVSSGLMLDIAAAMTYDPVRGEYLKAHLAKKLLEKMSASQFSAFFTVLHKQANFFRHVDGQLEKSNGEG